LLSLEKVFTPNRWRQSAIRFASVPVLSPLVNEVPANEFDWQKARVGNAATEIKSAASTIPTAFPNPS
jgi:hypothetical protein